MEEVAKLRLAGSGDARFFCRGKAQPNRSRHSGDVDRRNYFVILSARSRSGRNRSPAEPHARLREGIGAAAFIPTAADAQMVDDAVGVQIKSGGDLAGQ